MRKILWLAKREYKASVRTKGFIIGLLLAPLLMSGSGLAFWLLKDRVDTTTRNVAIIDHSDQVAEALIEMAENRNANEIYNDEGKKIKPDYILEEIEPNLSDPYAQRLELSNQIRNKSLHAFIEIGPDVVQPGDVPEDYRITYHSRNAAMDDVRSWITYPLNNHLRHLRLTQAGVSDSVVNNLMIWISAEPMGLASVDKETGEVKEARRSNKGEMILIPLGLVVLMLMMIMMGAMPLLNSVMEEKTQRIAEVLLGSVKPFQFMAGKILGGISISLTASSVYILTAIIAVNLLGFNEYIPYYLLPWFFAFMILAVLMMGATLAALGAACNNAKDAQSLTFPAMLPMMVSWFIMMPVLKEPTTGFATIISLIPTCAPILMMLRISSPVGIPMWQPWAALVSLFLYTLFSIWVGGRIFRVGILMQGKPPKLGNLIRWAIKG